jgi:hypothetical protein
VYTVVSCWETGVSAAKCLSLRYSAFIPQSTSKDFQPRNKLSLFWSCLVDVLPDTVSAVQKWAKSQKNAQRVLENHTN